MMNETESESERERARASRTRNCVDINVIKFIHVMFR